MKSVGNAGWDRWRDGIILDGYQGCSCGQMRLDLWQDYSVDYCQNRRVIAIVNHGSEDNIDYL
jgi:hypothetical protein